MTQDRRQTGGKRRNSSWKLPTSTDPRFAQVTSGSFSLPWRVVTTRNPAESHQRSCVAPSMELLVLLPYLCCPSPNEAPIPSHIDVYNLCKSFATYWTIKLRSVGLGISITWFIFPHKTYQSIGVKFRSVLKFLNSRMLRSAFQFFHPPVTFPASRPSSSSTIWAPCTWAVSSGLLRFLTH